LYAAINRKEILIEYRFLLEKTEKIDDLTCLKQTAKKIESILIYYCLVIILIRTREPPPFGEGRMKNKTTLITVLAIALLSSMFMVSNASAACSLPATATISFEMAGNYPDPPKEGWLPGIATLSGVGVGYDVTNGPTVAYCIELGVYIAEGTDYTAMLVCTDNAGSPWNEINWLLNNYPDSLDLQMAIWRLLGYSETFINSQGWPFTTATGDMYTAALAHDDFNPGAGDWIGLRCIIGAQDLLIKIKPECHQSPGLTPGFWKNNLAVYLGIANGNRGYSDPTGATTVTKDSMGNFFASLAGTYNLYQLYAYLSYRGGGSAGATIRNDAANIFNEAAGLADL
jgi:hypothetical protein